MTISGIENPRDPQSTPYKKVQPNDWRLTTYTSRYDKIKPQTTPANSPMTTIKPASQNIIVRICLKLAPTANRVFSCLDRSNTRTVSVVAIPRAAITKAMRSKTVVTAKVSSKIFKTAPRSPLPLYISTLSPMRSIISLRSFETARSKSWERSLKKKRNPPQ